MLVAIDTSTAIASLALVEDGQARAELTWHCGQNHTVELLPALAFLLERAGAGIEATSAIVVAKGPGSFNGLRVGVGTAKGLAVSLGVPLAGVGTLEVEAYPHAGTGLPICPIFNAGRGEVAAALYRKKRGAWLQIFPEHITTLDELLSRIETRTLFCGEYIPVIGSDIKKRLGARAVMAEPAANLRRALFLAELGRQRLEAGNSDDPASLQPLYLRHPPITRPRPRNKLEGR